MLVTAKSLSANCLSAWITFAFMKLEAGFIYVLDHVGIGCSSAGVRVSVPAGSEYLNNEYLASDQTRQFTYKPRVLITLVLGPLEIECCSWYAAIILQLLRCAFLNYLVCRSMPSDVGQSKASEGPEATILAWYGLGHPMQSSFNPP